MESGPATTSAKTRRRKCFSYMAHHKADGLISCKHMCCRDGVDKAPKPPKGSFNHAASLVEPWSLTNRKASKAILPQTKSTVASTSSRGGKNTGIQTIDLAYQREEYAENAPRGFSKLDKLHKSVNKGKSAPLMGHKKTSFDYLKDELPQVSFLSKNPNIAESDDKPSTDYGDDLMSDLPSPSALFGELPGKGMSPSQEKPTSYGSEFPDSSAPLRKDEEATDIFAQRFPDYDPLDDFDLPQINDDDQEDLEAAMVGMSDSMGMKEELQAQEANPEPTFDDHEASGENHEPLESSPPISSSPFTNKGNSSSTSFAPTRVENLFLSTDSPEQPTEQSQKRTAVAALGDDDQVEDASTSAPLQKRFRINKQKEQVLQPQPSVSAAKNEAAPVLLPSPPKIRPGQPAWVYDFDPAFIAEYQDFVDFI